MLKLSDVAAWTGGELIGSDLTVDGVGVDSREIRANELFVPIVAERDGHDFITQSLAEGATAYLTDREPVGGSCVVVSDTVDALAVMAERARERLGSRVVGVTGSVGKTTVKDMLASALSVRFRVAASLRSFNNEIGVPLTLLNAPDDTEVMVVEMGARAVDHIAALCRIAAPEVGVVTTVGLAHTELFGHLDEVVRAKGELVEALPAGGTAVLNATVPEVVGMAARTKARVLTFGFENADVAASGVRLDPGLRPRFHLASPWGEVDARLGVRGEHQVMNALAAAAAALACGVDLDDVANGLERAEVSPWRMDLQTSAGGALILNDAYNANPSSVAAALRSLALLQAARLTAVLGPMAELGDHGPAEHRRVAELASELGIRMIAVGAIDYGDGAEHVPDLEGALELLGPVGPGDAVLVKGSRMVGLERLAESLVSGG